MIGLRSRTFTSTAEFLTLGPVWPGVVIRGVHTAWMASASASIEVAMAISRSASESLGGLQCGDSLIGPGDELFQSSSVPCLLLTVAATVFASTTWPVYVPVEGGSVYVLLGLRATGAQTIRFTAGLVTEVEREVFAGNRVRTRTSAAGGAGGVLGELRLAAEAARERR